MDHKSLSQSVLGRIKEQHIEPKPHWHFTLKNVLFWVVFGLSVLIGARAMGVVIFVLSDLRPELLAQNGGLHGGIPPVMQILPLTWLLFFVLTILIAVLGLHHTKKGYKVSIGKIILINLLATLLLGGVLFALGDGERFEQTISNHVSFIPAAETRRERVWNTPVEGRLAGEIQNTDVTAASTSIALLDLSGKSWNVDLNGLPLPLSPEGNVLMRIRLVGVKTGEATFKANAIYPWSNLPPPPRREMMRQQNQQPTPVMQPGMQPAQGQPQPTGPGQQMPPPQGGQPQFQPQQQPSGQPLSPGPGPNQQMVPPPVH